MVPEAGGAKGADVDGGGGAGEPRQAPLELEQGDRAVALEVEAGGEL